MPAEVEFKLLADSPAALERLIAARRLGSAPLGPPRTFDEIDRYLDTRDGRLAAGGWACRLRDRSGRITLSLKGPPEPASADWLHRRPEVEGPATPEADPAAWPPSPARHLLESLAAGAPLEERLRLIQRRTERSVGARDGVLGTLSLDRVEVEIAGRPGYAFQVVELELAPGVRPASTSVDGVATALRATPGLTPDRHTKLERALAATR